MARWRILLLALLVSAGLGALFFSYYYGTGFSGDLLAEADRQYVKGEASNSPETRIAAFNQALSLYAQAEVSYHPSYGNGKLYYNIGNSYFQLGQYPIAALYYYRALNLRPGDERVKNNLDATLKKLRLNPSRQESWLGDLFLKRWVSLPRLLQVFAALCVLFFVFWSLYLWFHERLLKWTVIGIAFPLIFVSLSILYSFYFSPLSGVVTQATSLYKDAGYQYSRLANKLLSAGEKVTILEVLNQGKWLKVVQEDGTLGYIPAEVLRLI